MERLTDKQQHILRQKLCDMKRRCYNPKSKFYKDYGGRGIKVCDEWMDKKNGHANFQKWALESGWHEFLTIDRIDVNGNYEPSNCRWATPKEQSNNRRDNNYITIGGVTKTASEWADQVGISMNGFKSRINSGWSEKELLQPKKKPLKMTKAEMAREIRDWRRLKERGLLLKLPCKVGDRTYQVITKYERVKRGGCTCCTTACGSNCNCDYFTEDGTCTNLTGNSKYQIISRGFKLEDFYEFGKTVFPTKEEAEKALAEMEKNNG